MFSQSTHQISQQISGLTIDAVTNSYLRITLPLPNNHFISVTTKAHLRLESSLELIIRLNSQIRVMKPLQLQRWLAINRLSRAEVKDMFELPNTAVYKIFLDNARELIKNAIGAGASQIEIGFLRVGDLGIVLLQDNGKKGFFDLNKGHVANYLLLVGENSQQIDSDKKKRESDGGQGRGLIQLARSLQLCQGNLYVGSNLSTGALILLTAPMSAPIPTKLAEIKAEFNCYVNMDNNQPAITKNMLTKFQIPHVIQPRSLQINTSDSSGSMLSSLWNGITSFFSTDKRTPSTPPTGQSVSTFTSIETQSLDEPQTPPSLVRPGDQIQVDEMIDCYPNEEVKMITNYNSRQKLEFNEKGFLVQLTNYNVPQEIITYYTDRPKLRKTYQSQTYKKDIVYTECQIRTHSIFHSPSQKTLIEYNEEGCKIRDVNQEGNASMCRVM